MNKNPAFLFYSKDWLEGTAELMPDEKGVFIDLLAHQHQKGSLPEDTKRLARIVGLSHNQFMLIWDVIKSKFQNNNNRLVNQKLNQVVNQNISRALKNKINGCLPRIVESFNLNKKQRTEIYKNFRQSIDYDDYSEAYLKFQDSEEEEWENAQEERSEKNERALYEELKEKFGNE